MKTEFKSAIILGIVIVGGIAGLSVIFSTLDSPESASSNSAGSELGIQSIDKSKFKKAPDLVGISGYINTTPEELQDKIKDKVVLYDIWTYSCINCIRTLPFITAWDEKYSDQGLLIIGIHSPEFEFEKDINNVQMAVDKNGIKYPVVLDNDWETWKAFENRYWPHKFIADHEGYIRYDHIGEGGYDETEKIIQELLHERSTQLGLQTAEAQALVDINEFEHTSFRTPELYFGYELASGRNQFGNEEGLRPEKEVQYSIPTDLREHYFYMDGTWMNLKESMQLVSNNGAIILSYFAKEVNIVTANDAELSIFIDDEPITSKLFGDDLSPDGKLLIKEAGLYNIITTDEAESHVLKILVNNPGFEIFTFTFG